MRKALWLAGMAAFAVAQENAQSIYEVKYKYEKALKQIRGVQEVSVGGGGNDLRLLVRVESEAAREAVRTLLGDHVQGYKLHFLVSSTGESPASTGDCSRCACPCHHGGIARPTVAEPRKPDNVDPLPPEEACDILREVTGLPKRKDIKNGAVCQQMIGWTNDPRRIKWLIDHGIPHWRSQELGGLEGDAKRGVACPEHGVHSGGFIAYTYIKHRGSCPYGKQSLIEDVERLTPTK